MEKHGFCHAFLYAKTLLLQKHHVRSSRCSLFAFFLLFVFFCPCVLLQIHVKPTPQHYASHRRSL
jgi:hypothetical protein